MLGQSSDTTLTLTLPLIVSLELSVPEISKECVPTCEAVRRKLMLVPLIETAPVVRLSLSAVAVLMVLTPTAPESVQVTRLISPSIRTGRSLGLSSIDQSQFTSSSPMLNIGVVPTCMMTESKSAPEKSRVPAPDASVPIPK